MRKYLLIAVVCLSCIGLVHADVQAPKATPETAVQAAESTENAEPVAFCGRCGDGVCVPQCGENAMTCPQDCAGQPKVACD